jgi:hypothetical protein
MSDFFISHQALIRFSSAMSRASSQQRKSGLWEKAQLAEASLAGSGVFGCPL